jgi:hypothetical protein
MNQALYAHMNNKRKMKKKIRLPLYKQKTANDTKAVFAGSAVGILSRSHSTMLGF